MASNTNEINMELNDKVYEQIVTLAEVGDEFAENEIFGSAISKYQLALDLLPEPKTDWEAATWLYVALGDALFSQKEFDAALDSYQQALLCPDGTGNPYIWFCLGEVFYVQDNLEKAKTHFMSAYLLDGEEIFKDTNPGYLASISAEITEGDLQ
jgi:tetratricopeptide (TPR) repeat protein